MRSLSRQYLVAIRMMIVLTVLLGLAYPLSIMGIAEVALPAQANGSMVSVDDAPIGSSLIGQSFSDAEGEPLPQWFQPRPSASGYDGTASGGSNLGPSSADLEATIDERRTAIERTDAATDVPADALTASGSGLDPHISPEYARLQIDRVAGARGLDRTTVAGLVDSRVEGRDLGYLGEPRVNVLELNAALAELG